MAGLRHTYFNCLTEDRRPLAWEPPDVPPGVLSDSVYLGGVLAEMDRRLAGRGLTFYLTQDLHTLPAYGPEVVAVVIGDEGARVPRYAGRVRAIFKNQAVRPLLTSNVLREPSWVNFWWLVSYLRMWGRHLPGAASWLWLRGRGRGPRPAPIWLIPIGVLTQLPLPVKPPGERRYDVFFAGSVGHRREAGLRERIAPKVMARAAMVRSGKELADRHPELAVKLVTTGEFAESLAADPGAYSRDLMDARIALVPRGTTADTARFWQALRYGCVPVGDTVPRHRWFYDGAPVVRLGDWRQLEEAVVPLLSDEARLECLHQRSLEWWRTRGSEEAVGAYMADRLNRLGP